MAASTSAKQMSYAERARLSQARSSGQEISASETTETRPVTRSTSTSSTDQKPVDPANSNGEVSHTPSMTESIPSSASSVNGTSQISLTPGTTNIDETPASSVAAMSIAPSSPTIPDSSADAATPLPAKPPVNVWAIRREQMSTAQKPVEQSVSTEPTPSVAATQPTQKPRFGTGSGIGRTQDGSKPAAKTHAHANKARIGRNSAVAVGIVGSSQTVASNSSKPAPPLLASPSDQSMWPSPSAEPEAQSSMSRIGSREDRSISSGSTENQAGIDGANGKGKKSKWIPIQVDINVKSSSGNLPRNSEARKNAAGDRKKTEKSQSNSTSSRKAASGASAATAGEGALQIPSSAAATTLDEKARRSPAFQYDGKSSQLAKSRSESALGTNVVELPGAPASGSNGLNELSSSFVPGSQSAHGRYETAPAGQHAFGNVYPRGRGGRGGSYQANGGRGNARFANSNYPRTNGSSGKAPFGVRYSPNFTPASPPQNPSMPPSGGFGTSPPQNMGQYMQYPEYDPYYMQQQPGVYVGYNPYAPMPGYGFQPNGYPMYYPDPAAAVAPAPYVRPVPKNAHLLNDPPMDPTAYWLLGQFEFYLSEDNLARDVFLREQMDAEGWISIAMIGTFKRITALSNDLNLMRTAMQRSTELEVDLEQDLVRRRDDWMKWVMPNARPAKSAPPTNEASLHLQKMASSAQNQTPQPHPASPPASGSAGVVSGHSQGSEKPIESSAGTGISTLPLLAGLASKVQAAMPQLTGPSAQPTFAVGAIGEEERPRRRSGSNRQT